MLPAVRLHFSTSLAVRCGLVNWECKQKLRDEQEITLKKAGTLWSSPVPFLERWWRHLWKLLWTRKDLSVRLRPAEQRGGNLGPRWSQIYIALRKKLSVQVFGGRESSLCTWTPLQLHRKGWPRLDVVPPGLPCSHGVYCGLSVFPQFKHWKLNPQCCIWEESCTCCCLFKIPHILLTLFWF